MAPQPAPMILLAERSCEVENRETLIMPKILFAFAALILFSLPASAATLLAEDFESLALGPYVSPTESGGDGTDWTDVPPTGWVRDQGTTPAGSPAEFFGWTFHEIGRASC